MLKQQFDEVPWTIWQTLTGILWTLMPYLVFTLLFSLYGPLMVQPTGHGPISPQFDLNNAVVYFIYAIIGEGIFLVVPLYFAKQTSAGHLQSIMQALGFRRFDARRMLPWIILLLLSFFLINYVYQLLVATFHLPLQTNDQAVLEQGKVAPISMYATLLVAVVVAPLSEEVFFRSFVLMGFLRAMPVWVAIGFGAFIFAIVHADLASFAVLFCIGLALAFLRWYSNSIWPGIILHTLNNLTSAVTIVLALHHVIRM